MPPDTADVPGSPPPVAPPSPDPAAAFADLQWFDPLQWGVEGLGWNDPARLCDRFPARAQAAVHPDIWALSRTSTGICFRFRTDAPDIFARWTLLDPIKPAEHMTALMHSGLDFYATDSAGALRWAGMGLPWKWPTPDTRLNKTTFDRAPRECMVYLPLRNAVAAIEVGVPRGCSFEPIAPRPVPPIVFYGTSIVHGMSASRPGMCHTAILGRRLNWPVINLGFAGRARMEPEVGDLVGELTASVFVIDCLPNMSPPEVAQRARPFLHALRQRHPATPIVVVEDRTLADSPFIAAQRHQHSLRRQALRAACDELVQTGITGLYYLEGENLLGSDGEATIDRSHPTDLGFVRLADALEPLLRPLLPSP